MFGALYHDFGRAVFEGDFAGHHDHVLGDPEEFGLLGDARKDDGLDATSGVFNGGEVHGLLIFGVRFAECGDDAAYLCDGAFGEFLDFVHGGGDFGEVFLVVACRVIAHVESEKFFLPLELLVFGGGGDRHEADGAFFDRHVAEETHRVCRFGFFAVLRIEQNRIDAFENAFAFAEGVQAAHLGKCFDGLFVEIFGADALDKIGEIFESSVCFSFAYDFFGDGRADIFHGIEPEANALDAVVASDHGEFLETLIDRWRQDFDAHIVCLGDFDGDAIGIALVARQKRCHEFRRVVRLEVGGLVADEPVAGGVRAVESIPGKGFDEGEDFLGNGL